MTCYSPIRGFILINQLTENNKQKIVFRESEVKGKRYQSISLACGQCIGCRIDKSREWAIRCLHEAQMYGIENNIFVTLTYDDSNLNKEGTLVKKDFQNFMKEIRRQYHGIKSTIKDGKTIFPIRFFHCGEYGEACRNCGNNKNECMCRRYVEGIGRPHHHVCIFNFDFPDKKFEAHKNGYNWFTSESLSKIWKKGFHSIGSVTFESAAYVARYICKKITGEKAEKHYERFDNRTQKKYKVLPEYLTMSRRPGIGKNWYVKYNKDLYPKDFITDNGRKIKVPKFYNKMFEESYPTKYRKIKEERRRRASKNVSEKTVRRLIQKRKVKESMLSKLERNQI